MKGKRNSEAADTMLKYFPNSSIILEHKGNFENAREIRDFFLYGNFLAYEEPDIIVQYDGRCLAIEHFEFDSYKNSRKGSENKKELARIERSHGRFVSSKGNSTFHDSIMAESSYQHYLTNVTKIFSEHYKKIPKYKNHLVINGIVNDATLIKTAFLIEDVTPLGSIMYDIKTNNPHPIFLATSMEFLQLVRKSPDLEYVIACSEVNSVKYAWLIIKDNIIAYENDCIDYASMDFISWDPQVCGFNIIIHDDV